MCRQKQSKKWQMGTDPYHTLKSQDQAADQRADRRDAHILAFELSLTTVDGGATCTLQATVVQLVLDLHLELQPARPDRAPVPDDRSALLA